MIRFKTYIVWLKDPSADEIHNPNYITEYGHYWDQGKIKMFPLARSDRFGEYWQVEITDDIDIPLDRILDPRKVDMDSVEFYGVVYRNNNDSNDLRKVANYTKMDFFNDYIEFYGPRQDEKRFVEELREILNGCHRIVLLKHFLRHKKDLNGLHTNEIIEAVSLDQKIDVSVKLGYWRPVPPNTIEKLLFEVLRFLNSNEKDMVIR